RMAACTSTRCAASTDSTHGASAYCAPGCSAALTGSPRRACCTSWRRAGRPRRAPWAGTSASTSAISAGCCRASSAAAWCAHGVPYAEEYGWDQGVEALVAGIVARFVKHFDAARERCWIAESGGERVGAVLVVKQSRSAAQLRLLIVEPSARGRGLGRRLVEG